MYLSKQLTDEFNRNREKVLATSLKTTRDRKVPGAFPQMLRNYPGFAKLREAREEYAKQLSGLVQVATEDAASRTLDADTIIEELFKLATDVPITNEVLNAARQRFDRGNPPGKDNSYGDAITWESLLAHHPEREPLHLITADSDYVSALRPNSINQFLEAEWMQAKQSSVTLYPDLTGFFKAHYPTINLSTEVEHEIAVARLVSSPNFATTHSAVFQLRQLLHFSDSQVAALVDAALSNHQVRWIITDDDVKSFYEDLHRRHAVSMDLVAAAQLRDLLDGKLSAQLHRAHRRGSRASARRRSRPSRLLLF